MTAFDDDEDRRAISEDLSSNLLVEAAAGTGKTTELVHRLVRILEAGASVEGVVAVTFTRKAAGELKLRLRQALDEARHQTDGTLTGQSAPSPRGRGPDPVRTIDPVRRANLERAIAHLEEARIGTIHAFCADLLRERPVEARVDPAFEELTENEAGALYDRVFRRWFQDRLIDLGEGLRRALSRSNPASWDRKTTADRIRQAGRDLIEWRMFTCAWERPSFRREIEMARLSDLAETLALVSERSKDPADPLFRSLEPAREFLRQSQQRAGDSYALEGALLELLRDLERSRDAKKLGRKNTPFADGVTRQEIFERRRSLVADLGAFKMRANADLAALLKSELASLLEAYQAAKTRSGKLDFVDLLVKVRDLLRDDREVRRYFQGKFSHILIDEFQDTDPLQTEILLLLAADDPAETDARKIRPAPGKLFMVGDPKQSIYRFRRADVVLYQSVKAHLVDRGVRLLHLSHSFRAVGPIQNFVNAAFREALAEDRDTGQPGYVPLSGGPSSPIGQASIVALPPPTPFGRFGHVQNDRIRESLPKAVAAFIEWLVKESGWTVRDTENPSGARIPILPRHIAILFRKYASGKKDITREYVQELEARMIPHLLVEGRSFHLREEVETMRAALAAIEWPDDELSVFATLKGTLFAISDETLFRFRMEGHRFRLFAELGPDLDPAYQPIREALEILRVLHKRRNNRPIVETLNELLEATRAHAGFAFRHGGHHALANVQRVSDLARGYELSGGLSFRGFVEQLDREAETERSTEAPLLEEGAEGVRMMTVHKAKGLEFPVVILADLTSPVAFAEPDRYIDGDKNLAAMRLFDCAPLELLAHAEIEHARDVAEGIRVAYVAATRARDLLVVPAVGVEKRDGWFSVLNRGLYPAPDKWRRPELAEGCPLFGDRSALGDDSGQMRFETSVKPGRHDFPDYSVVWWDPAALRLHAHASYGLQQEPLLSGEERGGDPKAGVERHEAWLEARHRSIAEGTKRSIAPFAPTEPLAPKPPERPFVVEEVKLARDPMRPQGTRFGTLVHTILRDVAYDADEGAIRTLASAHGRLLGATQEEIGASVRAVKNALLSPVIRRAQKAERAHRELPILYEAGGGALLDGTMDLVFLERGTWTVVDFKTDLDTGPRRDQYMRQMRWYLTAMARIMDAPVRGILLSV